MIEPLGDEELDWLSDFLLNRIDEDTDVGDRNEGMLMDLSPLNRHGDTINQTHRM